MIRLVPAVAALACWFLSPDSLFAAQPGENLLPATTKGFFAVPDVDLVRERWDATDIGQLAGDPLMKPFMEDLKRQFQEKLSLASGELGITWDDLKGVYGGETSLAVIQPQGDKTKHAFVLICDVTGRLAEAQALLDKIADHLVKQKATLTTPTLSGVPARVFALPKKENRPENRQAAFVIAQDHLVASDNVAELTNLLKRMQGPAQDSLGQVPAFRVVMDRVGREVGQARPHVRWFVEPFGLIEVARSARSEPRRRGLDYVKIFRNQGFDAIQGMGGYVQVKTGAYEFLHHTFVHAPALDGASTLGAGSFKNAARILDFPNATLDMPEWLPRELATAVTFNSRIKEGFEYSKTLVDEIAGDPIFDDVIEGLRVDDLGPKIDIRKNVVAHLGTQVTVATDYALPITPDSERVMVAIELTNPAAAADAINKAMARDADVRKIPFGDHIIWEILDPTDTAPTTITLKIDGPGFGPLDVALQEEEDDEKPVFPNSAITVAFGRLIWTSQVDFAKTLLSVRPPSETLVASADYQAIAAHLEKLGAGQDSFRYFSRADEALRPTYELMRQGKMPEAKTLLGRALNELFRSEDDKLLRKQEIDAHTLPDYQVVRRHFGPAGLYVRTEREGWLAVGCGLSKRAE